MDTFLKRVVEIRQAEQEEALRLNLRAAKCACGRKMNMIDGKSHELCNRCHMQGVRSRKRAPVRTAQRPR